MNEIFSLNANVHPRDTQSPTPTAPAIYCSLIDALAEDTPYQAREEAGTIMTMEQIQKRISRLDEFPSICSSYHESRPQPQRIFAAKEYFQLHYLYLM